MYFGLGAGVGDGGAGVGVGAAATGVAVGGTGVGVGGTGVAVGGTGVGVGGTGVGVGPGLQAPPITAMMAINIKHCKNFPLNISPPSFPVSQIGLLTICPSYHHLLDKLISPHQWKHQNQDAKELFGPLNQT
ncbi:MAG: hypothetical protein DRI61_05330 [Chloroflexi bacterium]|nr:MAG: hypothetical protein DRI61_05330 [Chloroflexota bacterium]